MPSKSSSIAVLTCRVAALVVLLCAAPDPALATVPVPGAGGILPAAVLQDFDAGAFAVGTPRGTGTSSAQSTQSEWHIPIVMVAYSDQPFTYTPADFNVALFDTTGGNPTGSFVDYWTWASGHRLHIVGRVVAVVTLPNTVAYYGFNNWGLRLTATPNNMYGFIRDALQQCQASIDWSEFDVDGDGYVDILWVLHSGWGGEAGRDYNSLWSITSRLSAGWSAGAAYQTSTLVPGSTTRHILIDRFTTLPEISLFVPGRRSEIGVFCHEFGHALGLPDIYDTSSLGGSRNSGAGLWSLMATGLFGGNGYTPSSPTSPGSWALSMLGWMSTPRPTMDSTITLPPMENGGPAIDTWFEGEPGPEHFLVENRQQLGFDQNLPSPGLILYHLDDAVISNGYAMNRINVGPTPGLKVLEADGNDDIYLGTNRGDAGDPFPGALGVTNLTEDTWPNSGTFLGAPTGIELKNIMPSGTNVVFDLHVRAEGWQPPFDATDASYAPLDVYGAGRTAVIDPGGTISAVRVESRSGIPQVVLHTRAGGVWQPGQAISASPVSALGASIASLPGNDLAVVWSDRREGFSRLYYRARIGGAWGAETPLPRVTGDAYQPSIAADSSGVVYVTWLQVDSTQKVMFERFPYTSPFAQPRLMSDSTQVPENPSVVTSPGGQAFVVWLNRNSIPKMLWFARCRPDSGMTPALSLIVPTLYDPTAYAAVADPAGRLDVLWFVSATGTTEIHYQCRDFSTPFWQRDSVVELRTETLQSPSLALDSQGDLHFTYEAVDAGSQIARYKRFRPGRGWDARSTAITDPADGAAYRPAALPRSAGLVSVLYTNYLGASPRFMARDRTLDPPPVTAVPAPAPPAPRVALALGPDPLRPGEALNVRWSGPEGAAPDEVEVFDVAGRRVATAPLTPDGTGRSATLERARTAAWPAGLYLVRAGRGRAARLVVLP